MVSSPEDWKTQGQDMMVRGTWPWHRRAQHMKLYTVIHLKDAVKLRSRMGIREAFLEDDLVSRAIEMTKKPNKAKMKEAHAMEVHRLVNLGEGERLERGLPRLKGELLELAVLLRVETEPTDTIEKLKAKLQPTVALMKSQPSGAQVPARPKQPPVALAGRGQPVLPLQQQQQQQPRQQPVLPLHQLVGYQKQPPNLDQRGLQTEGEIERSSTTLLGQLQDDSWEAVSPTFYQLDDEEML